MNRKLLIAGICIFVAQCFGTVALSRKDRIPSPPPLDQFPSTFGAWNRSEDLQLAPEVAAMLGPDDVLNRNYRLGSTIETNLFIVYYKTQHGAKNAHDPKVCLPASGWDAKLSKTIDIPIPQLGSSIPVNYYVVSKGPVQSVVLYWYQTYNHVIAHEQLLHLQRLIDTFVENRTDMALVRIVMPVDGNDLRAATDRATAFAALTYPTIRNQFPSVSDPAK